VQQQSEAVGLAIQNYENIYKRLPPGQVGTVGGLTGELSWGPLARILRYMEQENIDDLIDLNKYPSLNSRESGVIKVQTFMCPSDPTPITNLDSFNTFYVSPYLDGSLGFVPTPLGGQFSHTNYRGNSGTLVFAGANNGIFYRYPPEDPNAVVDPGNGTLREVESRRFAGVRISDILDGTSNTAAWSERVAGDGKVGVASVESDCFGVVSVAANANNANQFRTECTALAPPYPTGASDTSRADIMRNFSLGGHAWAITQYDFSLYNHIMPPNGKCCHGAGRNIGQGAAIPPTSRHPGGVMMCLCDGSVRFINSTVSATTWDNLGNRKDGNAINF
jgi:prepilin-type processing-associated H-X9-DG protein